MYYDTVESGKRIKGLRKSKGYTQETFADELGMSPRSIASIESGARGTSIDTLVVICDLLDTSLDFIVAGKPKALSIDNEMVGWSENKKELAWKMIQDLIHNLNAYSE